MIGSHPTGDPVAALGHRPQVLLLRVTQPQPVALGTYRGPRFGMVPDPSWAPEVFLEGQITRKDMLSREHQGPRAVLNAVERLARGYGAEREGDRESASDSAPSVIDEARVRGAAHNLDGEFGTDYGHTFLHHGKRAVHYVTGDGDGEELASAARDTFGAVKGVRQVIVEAESPHKKGENRRQPRRGRVRGWHLGCRLSRGAGRGWRHVRTLNRRAVMAEQTTYPLTHQGVRDLDNPITASGARAGRQNVGPGERAASILLGGLLVGFGLGRGDLAGLVVALASAGLVCRGVTGHCAVYAAAGINTAR